MRHERKTSERAPINISLVLNKTLYIYTSKWSVRDTVQAEGEEHVHFACVCIITLLISLEGVID